MAPKRITITETNEINLPIATYIYSTNQNGQAKGRIDLITPKSKSWSLNRLNNILADVFLPAGYPHSVTDDYLRYQIFDSLQAFASSIAGLLSSRAVLQGVGVGSPTASPTSALLLHILQDTSGRLSTILFAHRTGTALEPECKMYRLAADIFNDAAMVLDCLSPIVPEGVARVGVLSAGGVLRAMCGVAGGSSKASLSAHFSRWGNLGEVNAKDSSQETIISLIGMLVGSLVVSHITSYTATWLALLTLISIHLAMNYAAVRAVQMTSLNRQRANIIFSALLSDLPLTQEKSQDKAVEGLKILTPSQVSIQERIFQDGSHLTFNGQKIGSCRIGVSIQEFLSSSQTPLPITELLSLFTSESYILCLSPQSSKQGYKASILLKSTSTVQSNLKAWMHALLAAHILSTTATGSANVLEVLSTTLSLLNENGRFEGYLGALRDAGWDTDVAALETRAGVRVRID